MKTDLTPDDILSDLVATGERDSDKAISASEELLAKFPNDPRLHFVRGSLMASTGRAIEAHRNLSRAVELAPEYGLARYQLGFFEMTSGEPHKALSTWGPLLAEGEQSYLRKFVEGMTHLIRDEFSEAIARFEEGIRLNQENEPMNGDIRLLIAECRSLLAKQAAPTDEADELSATSLMLGRFGGNKTVQ